MGRIQLVDLPGTSYAVTLRATAPDTGIGQEDTTLSAALAGWQDLSGLGLGPRQRYAFTSRRKPMSDQAHQEPSATTSLTPSRWLTKTWTRPDMPVLGNFSIFVEGYGTTILGGTEKECDDHHGHARASGTTLWHSNVLMAGVDIPTRPVPARKPPSPA